MQPVGSSRKLLDVSSPATPSPQEATMPESTSPRSYKVGDYIPGHGHVVETTDTAYVVQVPGASGFHFAPFYGPRGVDRQAPVTPLVTFGGR